MKSGLSRTCGGKPDALGNWWWGIGNGISYYISIWGNASVWLIKRLYGRAFFGKVCYCTSSHRARFSLKEKAPERRSSKGWIQGASTISLFLSSGNYPNRFGKKKKFVINPQKWVQHKRKRNPRTVISGVWIISGCIYHFTIPTDALTIRIDWR